MLNMSSVCSDQTLKNRDGTVIIYPNDSLFYRRVSI